MRLLLRFVQYEKIDAWLVSVTNGILSRAPFLEAHGFAFWKPACDFIRYLIIFCDLVFSGGKPFFDSFLIICTILARPLLMKSS